MSKNYTALIRKDGYRWAADLYKDGKLFYKSWQYNWRTFSALVIEIESMNVDWERV